MCLGRLAGAALGRRVKVESTAVAAVMGAVATIATALIGWFSGRRKTSTEVTITERDSLLKASQQLRDALHSELDRLYKRIGDLELAQRAFEHEIQEAKVANSRLEEQNRHLRWQNQGLRRLLDEHGIELPDELKDTDKKPRTEGAV